MVQNGLVGWKWPEHEDIKQLVREIHPPRAKNYRGVFSAPKMKAFRDFKILKWFDI